MNKSLYIIALLASSALSSCTSLLDFQTAKTLGKGKNELTVSVTSTNTKNDKEHTTPYISPSFDFTRGISDNFDLGVMVQPLGLSALHGKIQFTDLENKKYAFAGMMKLGYIYTVGDDWDLRYLDGFSESSLSLGNSLDDLGITNYNLDDIYTEAGVLGSYFINKEMAVTAGVKVIYLPISEIYTLGNSYGFEVGKKMKFSLNAGYNFYWEGDYKQKGFLIGNWQYGLGVKKIIKFKTKKEEPKTLNQ